MCDISNTITLSNCINYLSSDGTPLYYVVAPHGRGGFLFCEVANQFHQGVCVMTRDKETCPTNTLTKWW
jgi:hypothetical protein